MDIPLINIRYAARVDRVLAIPSLPDTTRRQLEAVRYALDNVEQCSGFPHLDRCLTTLEARYNTVVR